MKSELLSKQPAEKQYELLLNFLRAFQTEIDDKEQLCKRSYFGAIFELFDEIVRKAKKELNSVKLPALRTVVSLFSDITEANYSGPAKRQRLAEEMRNRLHSDTSIDPEDI
jgi:DNA sulfur modification protein DndB